MRQIGGHYRSIRVDVSSLRTLYELRFKGKSSPMVQVADLYLWPLAIAGYDDSYRAYGMLRDAGRLIECHLPEVSWKECGSKYSCFDLVHGYKQGSMKTTKAQTVV